jgi:hypothetical protein
MPARKFIALAAALALLALTAPAHAALVDNDNGYPVEIETINLTYANNFTLTGNLDIGLEAAYRYTGDFLNVYQNGNLVDPRFIASSPPGTIFADTYSIIFPFNGGDPVYLTPYNISLDGMTAIGGTVNCDVNCSLTPLPDALPMFAAALLALAGFAAWSRRAGRG